MWTLFPFNIMWQSSIPVKFIPLSYLSSVRPSKLRGGMRYTNVPISLQRQIQLHRFREPIGINWRSSKQQFIADTVHCLLTEPSPKYVPGFQAFISPKCVVLLVPDAEMLVAINVEMVRDIFLIGVVCHHHRSFCFGFSM